MKFRLIYKCTLQEEHDKVFEAESLDEAIALAEAEGEYNETWHCRFISNKSSITEEK